MENGTLTVPEGVNSITPGTIQKVPGCESITSITLPDTVTSIEGGAFTGLTNLTSVDLSQCAGLTSIGEMAFVGTGLTEIDLSHTQVTDLKSAAFMACANLKKVTLPNTVTSIESGAFAGSGLREIDLSQCVNLTDIGDAAFQGCANLAEIDLSYTKITKVGASVFDYCINLSKATLPNTMTSIGAGAFANCTNLTSVDLSRCTGLTGIGQRAFSECANLASIDLNQCTSLTNIEAQAFWRCSNLVRVILPSSWNGTLTIGTEAFCLYYSNDIQIYIPNAGATADSFNVAENAFSNRSKLFLYYNGPNQDDIKTAFTGKGADTVSISNYNNLPTQQNLPGQQSLPAFFDFFS